MIDAVRGVIRTVIVLLLVGLGFLFFSNVLRSAWTVAFVDVAAAVVLAALLYLTGRYPHLMRLVVIVMAALLIAMPTISFWFDQPGLGGTMPLFALSGVMISSLVWPATGLVVGGIETVILLWLAGRSEYVSFHAVAAFVAMSVCIYALTRLLVRSLERAEQSRRELGTKNAELERALQQLRVATERQERLLSTVQELETPLIEGEHGVGILVIVGHCSPERIRIVRETVFSRLQRRSFQRLIVDISGAGFDQDGLGAFVKTLQALRLIVSEVVVSGMAPQQAKVLAQDKARIHTLRQTVSFVHSLQEAFLAIPGK